MMTQEVKTVEKGVELFKRGDINGAIDILEDASRTNPNNPTAFVYLGAAYSQQGRVNAAIGALKRATELKPNDAKVHYNLGQAYESGGVPKEAWFEYKKAVEIDPHYSLAKGALASLAQRLPQLLSPSIEIAK